MEDRLSDLPDQLLTHILTLLPIEEAVQTCILSKRWVDVWTSMPILVFDDHKYLDYDLTDDKLLLRDYKFLLFVNGVLLSRETLPLDTFQITWCSKFSETYSYMSKILSSAAWDIMPRVLSVNIRTQEHFILPDSIFTCASVEEMLLAVSFDDWYDYYIEAESINLPRLKKLELHDMMIHDDFLRMLLSGCPVLEELVFDACKFEIDEISSTVLKKLTMKECPFIEIQISCPGVVYLDIDLPDSEGIKLKNMPSLVTANLIFISTGNIENYDVKLLSALSNVASLSINTNRPDIMDSLARHSELSQLKQLKELGSWRVIYESSLEFGGPSSPAFTQSRDPQVGLLRLPAK